MNANFTARKLFGIAGLVVVPVVIALSGPVAATGYQQNQALNLAPLPRPVVPFCPDCVSTPGKIGSTVVLPKGNVAVPQVTAPTISTPKAPSAY
jgi:hypothetical protein